MLRVTNGALAALVVAGLAATPAVGQAPAYQGGQTTATVSDGQAARIAAARMHAESGEARQADDPQAAACLRTAAFYVGDLIPERAAEWLIAAAEHAIARGDVETAAHSLVDAAISLGRSQTAGPAETAQRRALVERARLLATSPLLGESRRAAILERIGAATSGWASGTDQP